MCKVTGHWVVVVEHYFDLESRDLYTRWCCPVCGTERASKSAQIDNVLNRQTWAITVVVLLTIWGGLFLVDHLIF